MKPEKASSEALRTRNHKRQPLIFIIVGLFLIIIFALLAVSIKNTSRDLQRSKDFEKSTVDNSGLVPGYACGILNVDTANKYITSQFKRSFSHTVLPVTKKDNMLSVKFIDNCRYESVENGNNYVELHITTYEDKDTATHEFTATLPLVGSFEKLDPASYGERLTYGDGVYYILSKNIVIQVAASNANASQTKDFGRTVLDDVYAKLEL